MEILADSASLEEAARLLVPLKVPDLPLVLWCRGPAAFQLRAFDPLFPLADKVIVDSSTVPNASAALSFLRGLRARGCRVADLHWTRLTGWREILAHLFDDEALPAASITTARVGLWRRRALHLRSVFRRLDRRALPDARVSLADQDGEPGSALGHAGQPHLRAFADKVLLRTPPPIEVNGCGRHYRSFLPPVDEESLMREELNILGADLVYDRVLG